LEEEMKALASMLLVVLVLTTHAANAEIVRDGDTLYEMTVEKWGAREQTIADIEAANPDINDINVLRKGVEVTIPESPWTKKSEGVSHSQHDYVSAALERAKGLIATLEGDLIVAQEEARLARDDRNEVQESLQKARDMQTDEASYKLRFEALQSSIEAHKPAAKRMEPNDVDDEAENSMGFVLMVLGAGVMIGGFGQWVIARRRRTDV
jgi:phage tail protein X